jgi:hypothetical protein
VSISTSAAMGFQGSQPSLLKHHAAQLSNFPVKVLSGSSRVQAYTYPANTVALLDIFWRWPA